MHMRPSKVLMLVMPFNPRHLLPLLERAASISIYQQCKSRLERVLKKSACSNDEGLMQPRHGPEVSSGPPGCRTPGVHVPLGPPWQGWQTRAGSHRHRHPLAGEVYIQLKCWCSVAHGWFALQPQPCFSLILPPPTTPHRAPPRPTTPQPFSEHISLHEPHAGAAAAAVGPEA